MTSEYDKAKKLGDRQVHRAFAEGRYPYLPALDDLLEPGHAEYPVGLAEIPVSMIAGTKTKGRQSAFSAEFMPILDNRSEFATKWNALYEAQMEEGIRDPVKVYEYMQRFYVQEGNKRVSVMRWLDMPLIMADVIRVMPTKTEERDVKIYYEFIDFYSVAPIYEITFSEEGRYAELAEILGRDLTAPWPVETVKTVRSAFNRFATLFEPRHKGLLQLTSGDAFLLYLKIYCLDSVLNDSSSVIEKRISKIWRELLIADRNDGDKINLVEDEEVLGNSARAEAAAGSGLRMFLKGTPKFTSERPLRIAFLYDKKPEESSWIYSHELGRNYLEQAYEGLVETIRYDGCMTDEQISKAVESAAADDNELVITVSPAQMKQALRSAIGHPKMKFLNCSVNLSHSAVRSYYGRMYEAKFLMGALAASQADNHRIGYRADYPIYGSIANINAFAIGAAMVDPEAQVCLSWSTIKNSDWREEMFEEGVSVFSGPDMVKPQMPSREYGIYRYGSDGRIYNLAAPVWDWGKYYEIIVRTILNGTWEARELTSDGQAVNYWLGMSSGVIDVIMSDKISYYSRKLVNTLKQAVCAGSLSPFDGELRSQDGVIKAADAPRLTNEEIITMNWLNDNVIGSIPDVGELYEDAKETVQVSGVKAAEPPAEN